MTASWFSLGPRAGALLDRWDVRLALLCTLAVATALVPAWGAGGQEVPELRINSKRYIVIDAATGEIFAQRGAHDRAAMASLTKVLTAIEAIEAAPGEIEITTTEDDLVSDQASQMGFGPGETYTLNELLYGLMLPSGNDAARAIARTLGGQDGDDGQAAVDRFVARINERVRNMGLTETNLVNPDGWGVPNHYSSVHDLAVFTMYALRYPRFVELISTREYVTADGQVLRNNNRLLNSYESILGGKTGYDDDAGWCLIEVAERDGSRMISVTMDGVAPLDWYDDNRVLLEYAFEQKAARAASGVGIVGERVGYLDPDAAVIARSATTGGSIGAPAPAAAQVPGGSSRAEAAFEGVAAPARAVTDGQTARHELIAVGVATVVIVMGALGGFRRTGGTTGFAPGSPLGATLEPVTVNGSRSPALDGMEAATGVTMGTRRRPNQVSPGIRANVGAVAGVHHPADGSKAGRGATLRH